jgi:hypothetical protein
MKINELGNKMMGEGPMDFVRKTADFAQAPRNFLARRGMFGTEKGMAAQRDYENKAATAAHEKDFIDKLSKAYTQAVQAGMINVAAPQAQSDQTQSTDGSNAFGQMANTLSTPRTQSELTGAYDNLSPEEKEKVAAAKARRDAAYTQARGRQQKGPIIANTPAAASITKGATGGTKYTPTPRGNVQRLATPLRECDYSEFNSLLESIISEDGEQGGMSPGEWIMNYITQLTQSSGVDISKFGSALKSLSSAFQDSVVKSNGQFPDDVAKKIYAYYASAAASSPKRNQWGSVSGTSGQTATKQNTQQSIPFEQQVHQIFSSIKDPKSLLGGIAYLIDLASKESGIEAKQVLSQVMPLIAKAEEAKAQTNAQVH